MTRAFYLDHGADPVDWTDSANIRSAVLEFTAPHQPRGDTRIRPEFIANRRNTQTYLV